MAQLPCTPRKITIQPENDGLEDHFPFSRGVFSGSMLIFGGVLVYKRPVLTYLLGTVIAMDFDLTKASLHIDETS